MARAWGRSRGYSDAGEWHREQRGVWVRERPSAQPRGSASAIPWVVHGVVPAPCNQVVIHRAGHRVVPAP